MSPLRLAFILAALPLLAACESNTKPPEAPVAEAPPAPKPAAAPDNPASAKAAEPIYGNWAVDLNDCAMPAVLITETKFQGGGQSCEMSGLNDNGDGSFTATLSCDGATAEAYMIPVFAPSGEGLTLSLPADAAPVPLLRCVE